MLPFSKSNIIFFGYFDPENIFYMIQINNFRGELTDNSAKKEALICTRFSVRTRFGFGVPECIYGIIVPVVYFYASGQDRRIHFSTAYTLAQLCTEIHYVSMQLYHHCTSELFSDISIWSSRKTFIFII